MFAKVADLGLLYVDYVCLNSCVSDKKLSSSALLSLPPLQLMFSSSRDYCVTVEQAKCIIVITTTVHVVSSCALQPVVYPI